MPKKNTKSANEIPVIDECEVEGFVNVGLPISPHVNFNLSRNKEHDSIREKKPLDMFYTRWELSDLVSRSCKEEIVQRNSKGEIVTKSEDVNTYLPLKDDSSSSSNTSSETIFRQTHSSTTRRTSRKTPKTAPQRRRHQPTLAHTFFGAQFGITQRTQMDAYRLWIDSDSSDEELDVEKDEGKRCCGLCVVQ
jgi:hypothetical protein